MMTSDGYEPAREDSVSERPLDTRVLVLWENGSATYFLRPEEQATLGRHRECEIVINLPSVSRRHARLSGAGSNVLAKVEDIGGMHGVLVRGQKIAPGSPVAVAAGDVVELGGAIFVLHPPRYRGAPSAGAFAHAPAPVPARDDPMKAVDRLIDVVAQSDLGVLLVGEAGVGKTFTAEAIHARSGRAAGPLLRLNCAALPEPLLEGELFGYERGAFPGAAEAKAGLLESASGGTILLDEIDAMPLGTQAKLRTVLETRDVLPLGGDRPRPIDVRFVVATNQDLLEMSSAGAFRLDLYYRLNGISLVIPALRERKGEIPRFASKFLTETASKAGRPAPRLSNEALGLLVHHAFPGNIRELKSTMERAFVLARGGYVGPEHMFFDTPLGGTANASRPPASVGATTRRFGPVTQTEPPDAPTQEIPVPIIIPAAPRAPAIAQEMTQATPVPQVRAASSSSGALRERATAFERDRIVSALEECNGNQTRAAEALGISRRALIARIEQYGLPRPRKR